MNVYKAIKFNTNITLFKNLSILFQYNTLMYRFDK